MLNLIKFTSIPHWNIEGNLTLAQNTYDKEECHHL